MDFRILSIYHVFASLRMRISDPIACANLTASIVSLKYLRWCFVIRVNELENEYENEYEYPNVRNRTECSFNLQSCLTRCKQFAHTMIHQSCPTTFSEPVVVVVGVPLQRSNDTKRTSRACLFVMSSYNPEDWNRGRQEHTYHYFHSRDSNQNHIQRDVYDYSSNVSVRQVSSSSNCC